MARKGPGMDITTNDQFRDFELPFEWKVGPGANCGLMYRVSEDQPASYMTGPEYQVLDNARHADGRRGRRNHPPDEPMSKWVRTADICWRGCGKHTLVFPSWLASGRESS